MGRLFWKFFFFIWLAQLTTSAGVSGLVWLKLRALEDRPVEISQSPPAAFMVNSAAATLQYGGPQALKDLLESREQQREGGRRNYNVVAVDESGTELLGRDVAPNLVDQARQISREREGEAARGVREVKAGDGHTYTLFLPAPVRGEPGKGGDAAKAGPSEPGRGMGDGGPGPRPGTEPGSAGTPGAGPPPEAQRGDGPRAESPRGDSPRADSARSDGPRADGPRGDGPRGGSPARRGGLREWRLFPVEPLIGGMLASFVFAALLALYIARPIKSLRGAFDAAAGGNLNARVGPDVGGRRDELADLGRDFDHMAGRLQAVIEGQRRLLHDVSHEMRSPLARMQAAIGIARQGDGTPQSADKLVAAIERVERETVRIDALVGELLTLARLDAGVPQGQAEAVNVSELIADIVEDARFEANARERDVTLDTDELDVILQGRGELLHRVFENVIRNAVKHTKAGTTVEVHAHAAGGLLRVAVEDQGPGVGAHELESIFEPFFRAGNSAGTDGHGLGLAIARRVVQAHGGSIQASNREGGGLRMEIVLPLGASAAGKAGAKAAGKARGG